MSHLRKILFKVEKTECESFSIEHQEKSGSIDQNTLITSKEDNSNKHTYLKKQPKYYCSLCEKNCHSNKNYKSHLKKHDKHEFQCGICKEVCSDKPHLANHMRGNHLFPCNECHKIFSTQDDHTHHENSHFVRKFLIGFIALMCRTDITKNKASKRAMSSSSQDRRIKKIKLILLKRSKLLHKHQQVKEFNKYDDSTENDD